MAKTAAERMAAYRLRHRISGLTSVSLMVPREDAAMFQQLAATRRELKSTQRAAPLRQQWFRAAAAKTVESAVAPTRTIAVRPSTPSRAEELAEKILKLIIRSGWPVGSSLGSEVELMKQFAVSRTVLRQAIRLLAHHAVARMQRGVNGGLVVDAPNAGATARAMSIYLEYQRISPRDILETRKVVEAATVSLAVRRLSHEGAARLLEDIAAESSLDGHADADSLQRLHFTIAELSGDPALRLFTGTILRLCDAHSNFSRRPDEDRDRVVRRIKKLHAEIAKAIIARDAETASRFMARYLDGYKGWMD